MNIDQQRAAEAGLPWGGHARPDPPLNCFPMRADLAPAETAPQYPAPLHTSNDSLPDIAPRPIADLAMYAAGLDWEYMITYAHGWVPHARLGTPGKAPKTSWAVRLRRGPFRAVAVRMDDSWASMWTWSDTDRFVHHRLLDAFKEALR